MFYANHFFLLFFLVKLHEKFVIDSVKVLCARSFVAIEHILTHVFLESTFCKIAGVVFFSIVGVFASQNLITMFVVPGSVIITC